VRFSFTLFPSLFPPFPLPFFLLTLHTLVLMAWGVYTDLALSLPGRAHFSVHPSLLPAFPQRRVRHAPRPPALPPARPGLLHQHDTERATFSDYEATTRMLDAPSPPTPTPSTPDPTHARYATQQVFSFFDACATVVDPVGAAMIRLRAPQLGYATPPPCAAPHAFILQHIHLSSPPGSLRPLMRRPSASPGYHRRRSTPTRPTPCLRTLGTSHRLSCASSVPTSLERGVRHPPQLPAAPAAVGERLQHHHTARDIPRDYEPARCARCTARLRRRLMRAIVPPTPYHASAHPHRQPYGQ
jgi:hypothetical protein